MKLLFDEMLKHLASWCRILGIDSEFLSGRSDSQLLEHAKKTGRVFITRDLSLSLRCKKRDIRVILIKSDAIEEQLAQVIKETGVKIYFPEKTRCAICNGELDVVPKESVVNCLPTAVTARHNTFWKCRICGKVFWEGGHWKNIRKVYARVKELLAD